MATNPNVESRRFTFIVTPPCFLFLCAAQEGQASMNRSGALRPFCALDLAGVLASLPPSIRIDLIYKSVLNGRPEESRSEERRVGKECSVGWWRGHKKAQQDA